MVISEKAKQSAIKATTMSTKAATVAMKGLAIVGNMLMFALIVKGVELLVKGLDNLATTTSEAKESLEESVSAFDKTTEEIKSLNNELKTTEDRIKELQKLSDAGTISVADEKELETLKEQNKEIERQIALKQAQQIEEQKEVLEDNKDLLDSKVRSNYDYTQSTVSNGQGRVYNSVTADKELSLAISEYEKLQKDLLNESLSDGVREDINDKIDSATKRISEMYDIISPSIEAYDKLVKAGYKLEGEEKTRYELLKKTQDEYLLYNYNLNGTKEAFHGLNVEQQKNILLNKLLKQGLSETDAQSVLGSISDTDLSEYWDKDFSFEPPILTDYATAEEYGKAYAEAWLNGVKSEIKKEEVDPLSITDTVNNINKKLKPALDSLVDTYTTLFSEEGYEWQPINVEEFASIKEQLDSLSEDFGINVPTKDYENFVKILSDSATTAEQAQQAFDDLATSMINNSDVVELTDENFDVLKNSLENLGVKNATEIFEQMKDAQNRLVEAGFNLRNITIEEAEAFIKEAGAADIASQYLQMHMLKKRLDNDNPLNTYNSVQELEKECKALKITGDLLDKTAKLKSLYYAAERNLGNHDVLLGQIEETKSEIDDIINNQYSYKFKFDGNLNKNGSGSDKSAKDTAKTFNWIETLISRIQRNITNLGKLVSATYRNWSTRNNALAQEMAEVNKEINAQMTAYNAYMEKANSIPLAEGYKALVRSGAYDISTITDEKLQEQISEYEEWYNKALDASDAIEDLRANLADLAKTKFDNISEQYDEQISLITHNVSMLEGFVSQSEAAGYMASEVYYKAMAEKQQENIAQLQGEYSSLLSAFDEAVKSGSIEKYSSDWYEMLSAINDVELELQDATTQLVEFNQTLQQLSWEVFDRIRESVNDITTEAEFLIDILDSKDLHTDKGVITDEGLAVQGLHAVNYNTYMEQAIAYAEEMRKIEAEMANDPYDMELVDRRNELLELQQEAIQNSIQEKEAIRDLAEDGYNKMLDSLQATIDKRKKLMGDMKSLRDYEKSISDQTSEIASLEKQLIANSGNDSESAKALTQQIRVKLQDARESLEESEYDRYLSDMESMYDNLYSETEQFVNERLDDIDGLISESIDATNKNAETISNTIKETANSYGYGISDQMETIWDSTNDVVCTYGDILKGTNENIANNITIGTTNVVTAINGLNGSMQSMIGKLNEIATANKDSIAQAQNAVVNGQNSSYPTNNSANNATVSTTPTSNTTPKDDKPKTNTPKTPKGYYAYIGDEKVGHSQGFANEGMARYAAEVEVNRRAEKAAKDASSGVSGSPAVQIYNNVKAAKISELMDKVNAIPFYASGTPNAKKGWAVVGEEGNEIIIDKDGNAVLTLAPQLLNLKGGEQVINGKETSELLTSNLMPLSADQLWGNIVKTPKLPEMSKGVGGNVTYDVDKVELVLPNVKDYDSLVTEMQHDKRFERIVQSMTTDRLAGKGSLNKYKF